MTTRSALEPALAAALLACVLLLQGPTLASQEVPWRALAQHGEYGSVSARVLDEFGVPIGGADVWLLPAGEVFEAAGQPVTQQIPFYGLGRQTTAMLPDFPLDDLSHTTTDSTGAFTLQGPTFFLGRPSRLDSDVAPVPRRPQLVIHAEGFAVRVEPLDEREPELLRRSDLRLVPEAAVTGTLTDEDGVPLEGARVRVANLYTSTGERVPRALWHWAEITVPRWHVTTTDASGRFRLGALWPGSLTVEVLADEFVRQELGYQQIHAGEVRELGEFALSRSVPLVGQVLELTGAPVAGARVFASRQVPTASGRGCVRVSFEDGDDTLPSELDSEWYHDTVRGVTRADGSFELRVAPDTPLWVFVRRAGLEPARVVVPAAHAEPLRVTMLPAAELTVRVLDARGRDVSAGAQLLARRVVGLHKDSGRLDVERLDDGRFVVRGVGPRGTRLIVEHAGSQRTELVVAEGALPGSAHEATVVLSFGARISGQVLDRTGRPAFRARISLTTLPGQAPSGSRRFETALTDADGRFRFEGLAPAGYAVRAQLSSEGKRAGAGGVAEATVELTAGEVHDRLVLALQSPTR